MPAILFWGMLLASPAAAAIQGRLVSEGRADLAAYVVWIEEGAGLPAVAAPEEAAMSQVRKQFSPRAVAVRAGGRVRFENRDDVFHNVFSLDKRNPFDLGLYKGNRRFSDDGRAAEAREPLVLFASSGSYKIFCNIHPDMEGTVRVFSHGYFAVADKDGLFTLPAPSSGTVTVAVDGPRLGQVQRTRVDVGKLDGPLEVPVRLKRVSARVGHTRKDGSDYGESGGGW